MKVLEQQVEFLGEVPTDPIETMKYIEIAGRTAYQSWDNMTKDSYVAFTEKMYKSGHWPVLDHSNIVMIINDLNFEDLISVLAFEVRGLAYLSFKEVTYTKIYVAGNITAWLYVLINLNKFIEKHKEKDVYASHAIVSIQNLYAGILNTLYDYLPNIFNSFTKDKHYQYKFKLVKNKDEIPKELKKFGFRIVTNRGVSHEIVRHRPCSFLQECLTGDTIIAKNGRTIKELFDRENGSCYGKTHNKTISLMSCDEENWIISNKFTKVFYKGICDVYEVTTSLGYKIKSTLNHKFMSPSREFKKLQDLKIGDEIMVNGRLKIGAVTCSNASLKRMYLDDELNPEEISEKTGFKYKHIIDKLKELDVFIPRLNDKNKEKYNKNHTKSSYEKMRNTIKQQYKNGRKVWNKGLTENDSDSVKRQAESLRKNHYNNQTGENNSNWQGGTSNNYYLKVKSDIKNCEICGEPAKEVHHKNKKRTDNREENIIKLCRNCHKKIHKDNWKIGKKAHPDQIVSINYIGKEDVYDLEMKAPLHNYVANGFIVHNSTRWIRYDDLQFVSSYEKGTDFEKDWNYLMSQIEAIYSKYGTGEVKTDRLRSVLPNDTKTEIIITTDLKEYQHIIKLRTHKSAHFQFQYIANEIQKHLAEYL